ncbi:MAG: hypothetical protein J6Y65_00655 [Eggerthellaceae bacterium]|nr:hypothetical protein [Eggerthellaceae bacterium]
MSGRSVTALFMVGIVLMLFVLTIRISACATANAHTDALGEMAATDLDAVPAAFEEYILSPQNVGEIEAVYVSKDGRFVGLIINGAPEDIVRSIENELNHNGWVKDETNANGSSVYKSPFFRDGFLVVMTALNQSSVSAVFQVYEIY